MHKRLCILSICLVLSSISALRRLNNFDDLRNVNYGKHFPRHGLKLLFWFAQIITSVDQNNVFQVNFEPRRGDFGFHRFRNYEHILPPLNYLYDGYYSVGNLNSPAATALPNFVTWDCYSSHYPEHNMDRFVAAVIQNNPTRINRVFLTSHTYQQNSFEPYDTYHYDRYTFEDALRIFNEPGLAAFLTLVEYDVYYSYRNSILRYSIPNFSGLKLSYQPRQYDKLEQLKLEVRTTSKGYAKLIWENIPVKIQEKYPVQVAVCISKYTDQGCYVKTVDECSSFSDTSVALNPGLQPQLFIKRDDLGKTIIFHGPVFDEANRVIPTTIIGFDASLQLYTKDGWACSRLFIKKTFSDWKKVFYNSWVGFYSSKENANNKYYTYQWVVKFDGIQDGRGGDDYDVYQYESSLAIAPGVQIRFLLDKRYDYLIAQTLAWEDSQNVTVCEGGTKSVEDDGSDVFTLNTGISGVSPETKSSLISPRRTTLVRSFPWGREKRKSQLGEGILGDFTQTKLPSLGRSREDDIRCGLSPTEREKT
ncbi:uncharacterized protein [Paramisgurnus dabryanus]|uniref:uncharacterized protein n=1 Tax=Paramisgurnus dabryanus TaxID=90735 RepID=UPI0031F41990